MNKDRGTIKWTALMLPEHIQRLKAWELELQRVLPKELSEWELAELQQTIQLAYEQQYSITITCYHKQQWQTLYGVIQAVDMVKKELLMETDIAMHIIPFSAIQVAEYDD